MTKDEKILCCRISWMQEYQSREEKAFSYHRYILEKNTPYEALNFLASKDGLFRGYVPVGGDTENKFGKISIARLGASASADRVEGITVIFCAPNETKGGLMIVGFYRNATVLREPEISHQTDRTHVTRVISKDAVLIPVAERAFTIPGRNDGGFGQSSLWYGLNQNISLRDEVLRYVGDTSALPTNQPSVMEYKRRKLHESWEGRGAVRGFIHQKGFRCEACSYAIPSSDQPIWGSGFELHHLVAYSLIEAGTEQRVSPEDFAVLCATCHRAIHRTDQISDVAKFRMQVLSKRSSVN